ncbi:MAG: hypothetical protein AB7K09_04105, partial [Planctomycetota bacterium]
MRVVADWLENYRRFWEESFDRLDDYLRELQATPAPATPTPTPPDPKESATDAIDRDNDEPTDEGK